MIIDFVFIYVNGSDQKHIEKKNNYMNDNNKKYNKNIRYENIDEIKYSVNSIIKNLKWINKIYIVTDEQIPPINDILISTGKVVIIDHKQIIPSEYLPTFYSDVIESYIYKIPGLSDFFLYGNDDCFCLSKMKYSDFYNNKKFKIYASTCSSYLLKLISNQNEYFSRIYNTVKMLKAMNINKNNEFIISHQIKFFKKKTLEEIENIFSKELNILRKNKFRNNTDINYHFLVMNYENFINNNNKIIELNYYNSLLTTGDNTFNLLYELFNYNIITKNYLKKKFVCFNSLSFKNKFKFLHLMKILKLT
jgi:hypothetical protein